MANYGTHLGKGNNFGDATTINNRTIIDKRKKKTMISVTIGIVFVLVVIAMFGMVIPKKTNISGTWMASNGETIEFLSDGTIHQNGYDSLYPDTYEIMDEGYLKWGQYDAGWIEYRYTYWDIEANGDSMILTRRDNPDYSVELTKKN